jgi:hypothetical protein
MFDLIGLHKDVQRSYIYALCATMEAYSAKNLPKK